MSTIGTLKICTKCKKRNPIIQFHKKKTGKYGVAAICNVCHSLYMKIRYQKNKSAILGKQHTPEYRKNAFDKYKIRKTNNPFPMRAKEWRNAMKTRSRKNNQKYDEDFFTIKYLVNLQKTQTKCECCNVDLDFTLNNNGIRTDQTPSLDRFNPKKGYTKDNVVMICWKCNRLKFDGTLQELKTIIRWMESRLK